MGITFNTEVKTALIKIY